MESNAGDHVVYLSYIVHLFTAEKSISAFAFSGKARTGNLDAWMIQNTQMANASKPHTIYL